MYLMLAFALSVAAVLIVNEARKALYRIHRKMQEMEFERWLECHPEV